MQLRSLVERHPLLAFFGLTFALSWSVWGLQFLLATDDPISARWLGIIATYGPTLAAIALAGLLHPERQAAFALRHQLWLVGGVLMGTVLLNVTVASNPPTVLFTWFYNRTKGNLWLVVLLHTAVNNTAGFWLPVTVGVYAAMLIMMVALIITDRMWRMQPHNHRN